MFGGKANWKFDWDRDLFLPLLVASLLTALAKAFFYLIPLIFNSVQIISGYTWLVFILSLEGFFSTRYLHAYYHSSNFSFRCREIVLILALIRFLLYLTAASPHMLLSEIWTSLKDHYLFFYPSFWVNSLALLIPWYLSLSYAEDLLSLQIRNIDSSLNPHKYPPWVFMRARLINSSYFARGIASRFFWGGIFLVVALGAIWHSVVRPSLNPAPEFGYAIWAGLLYYSLGLLLMSRVHYLSLKIDWLSERMITPSSLSSVWVKTSLMIIFFFILSSLLLPTSFSPLSWKIFLRGISGIARWLFERPWPRMTFSSDPGFWIRWRLPPWLLFYRYSYFPGLARGLNLEWWSTFKWISILLLVGAALTYALYPFFRNKSLRREIFLKMHSLMVNFPRFFAYCLLVVTAKILQFFCTSSPQIISRLMVKINQSSWPGKKRSQKRKRRLRGLSFATHIYLSLIALATRLGYGYQKYQTAYEYSGMLIKNIPEGQEQIRFLTDSFVWVRYGKHLLREEEKDKIKRVWKRLRRNFLQRLKKKEN